MASPNSGINEVSENESRVSLQVADVIVVSVDTRGFSLARALALQGWKTVVIELSGSSFNSEIEWPDRVGPFLGWEPDATAPPRTKYGAMWLATGPVAFGGPLHEAGQAHLAIRYGVSEGAGKRSLLEKGWPLAMLRSIVATRLMRREQHLDSTRRDLELPLHEPVGDTVNAEDIAVARRAAAIACGVRIFDADQITAVRLSDRRIDRIEFKHQESVSVERTRSLVWMLSEEESRRIEFVAPEVPLEKIFEPGRSEPLMAWWRNRLAVRGLKTATSKSLGRPPHTPPHVVVVGSIERPWTHDNLVVLDLVEDSTSKVFDVWSRIPYWARVDHVYRDEQRLLIQNLLSDRFVGCELNWVTPSPLALTEPAIRMPHILYGETSVPTKVRLENISFAGPETWSGIGLQGLRAMEPIWIQELEKMRIQWDPIARLKASRIDKLKHAVKNAVTRMEQSP